MSRSAKPYILGLASSHNGGACLICGNEILVAVQEERLVRRKRYRHPPAMPTLAVQYCLETAGIKARDLNAVAVCCAGDNRVAYEDVTLNSLLRVSHCKTPVFYLSHHLGHAVGAFSTSGVNEAAVLVVDGQGSLWDNLDEDERAALLGSPPTSDEIPHYDAIFETLSVFVMNQSEIQTVEKQLGYFKRKPKEGMRYFQSLGQVYSAVGEQIFGDVLEGPGKVMGLAPYGNPTTPPTDFLSHAADGRMIFHDTVPDRFQQKKRWPDCQTEYKDLAASVQKALEESLETIICRVVRQTGQKTLCYSGGVALNSVANEKLFRRGLFSRIYIMPAAEDSGTAIGAAYYGLFRLEGHFAGKELRIDSVGRGYSPEEIDQSLASAPAVLNYARSSNMISECVDHLAAGKILGWFQGRSELGPRALGHRSILGDPRNPNMKNHLNARVKFREGFRPFAPVIPEERAVEFFESDIHHSPFMLRVLPFREHAKALVPAVVHIDGSGRVQTVNQNDHPKLHALLCAFGEKTGVPILLNTSFNVAGEPIVETPADAILCFLGTGIDVLAIEDRIIVKAPDFTDILDLPVKLTMDQITVTYSVLGGRIILEDIPREPLRPLIGPGYLLDRLLLQRAPGTQVVRLTGRTPWGAVSLIADPLILPIFKRVDGKRVGRDILCGSGVPLSPREQTQLLLLLLSYGLIEFA